MSFRVWNLSPVASINRIRLEFKYYDTRLMDAFGMVLIESDWNLKFNGIALTRSTSEGINRIRLEFKDNRDAAITGSSLSINRIRLEFKDEQDH